MKNVLFYLLIILFSCVLTAGLNVLHSTFILRIPLTPRSFIIPVFAGAVFGLMLAHINMLRRKLGEMAYTDPLTGITNRIQFNRFLEAEMEKTRRYGGVFSVIFFDIDHFKSINDKYGHLTGDAILCELTERVHRVNRSSDIFARYGGEEFIILATATDLHGASLHAERLRSEISESVFSDNIQVTCSFGVTEFDPKNDTATSLINRADAAMYAAKHDGRNRVVAV